MFLKKIIEKDQIYEKLIELSNEINSKFKNEKIVIFYIEKGAKLFFEKLSSLFTFSYQFEPIALKSYSNDKSKELKWIKPPTLNIEDKYCLIIDDILDTGKTLNEVTRYLLQFKPKSVYTCVAIDKKERREINIEPNFRMFEIEQGFVIGFGMDYNEDYRNIEELYIINFEKSNTISDMTHLNLVP